MAPDPEIERVRQMYIKLPDAELIRATKEFVPYSPAHIAAEQILDERRKASDESRHQQTLKQTNRANMLSVIAVVIALVALVVSIQQCHYSAEPPIPAAR